MIRQFKVNIDVPDEEEPCPVDHEWVAQTLAGELSYKYASEVQVFDVTKTKRPSMARSTVIQVWSVSHDRS